MHARTRDPHIHTCSLSTIIRRHIYTCWSSMDVRYGCSSGPPTTNVRAISFVRCRVVVRGATRAAYMYLFDKEMYVCVHLSDSLTCSTQSHADTQAHFYIWISSPTRTMLKWSDFVSVRIRLLQQRTHVAYTVSNTSAAQTTYTTTYF